MSQNGNGDTVNIELVPARIKGARILGTPSGPHLVCACEIGPNKANVGFPLGDMRHVLDALKELLPASPVAEPSRIVVAGVVPHFPAKG